MTSFNIREKKFLIGAVIALFLWFAFFFDYLTTVFATSQSRFLVFNVGISLIFALSLKGVFNVENGTLGKFLLLFMGSFLATMAIDIILPEYHVSHSGELIVGGVLGDSASDFVVGSFWKNTGLGRGFVYYATYVLSPLLLLVGAKYVGFNLRDLV